MWWVVGAPALALGLFAWAVVRGAKGGKKDEPRA